MKCILLAAGYATRLYPLTENFPKPLLTVGDKTIVDWLIDDLKDNVKNIDEYVIITNHKFYNHFVNWSKDKASVTIVDDNTDTNENRLGAVKDILYAIKALKIDDDVLVLAGDNLLDFSLCKFIKFAENKKTSCVMCHEENNLIKQQKTAIITIDDNNLITSYEEKPKSPKGNLAVPPFYFYLKKDIGRIEEALNDGCNPDAPGSFAAWLSEKTQMHAYKMPGKRYDIGDIKSYEHVKVVFSKYRSEEV